MHTSSAVHIRIVFGQLRTFWNQLAWPDAETAYVFVSRILDDICKGKCLSQYMEWIQSNIMEFFKETPTAVARRKHTHIKSLGTPGRHTYVNE